MFNRTLRVDVVKKEKSAMNETNQPGIGFEEKTTIVAGAIEHGIKKVGIVVCAYVILDTIRRIAVASASE